MASHAAFLVVKAKIAQAQKALHHMQVVDAKQRALATAHPSLYYEDVHAESMATNVQWLYTQFEAILKTLLNIIDGFVPSGEASHRDTLIQASVSAENREAMISQSTFAGLTELLKFRHAVRNNYASDLRTNDVFKNVALTTKIASEFFKDLCTLIEALEKEEITENKVKPSPPINPSDG